MSVTVSRRLLIVPIIILIGLNLACAKKIKSSYSIDKDKTIQANNKKDIEGYKINLADSLVQTSEFLMEVYNDLKKVGFAGYDKEPNSSKESFMLINNTDKDITGCEVRIDYLDMQGRMLHSRTITEACFVPGGETRRFDINSWDTQRTYYYYLGNQPRRVATPFQVVFHPLSFWISNNFEE